MSTRHTLRAFTITLLLLLGALSATGYVASMFGGHNLVPGVHTVAGVSIPNVLGLDCAYGSSVEGGAFPSSVTTSAPYSAPDFDGTLDSICQATYLADTDGAIHPLVSDNPTGIVPAGAGGGFTVDVVALLNSTTTINGFDISVKYDPHFLNGVIIDQSGLIWGGTGLPVGAFVLTLAKTIDNVNGVARVAQVLVGAPQPSGASELFRVRFDLVGASTGTPVQIVSDTLTNPGNVQHNTNAPTSIDTTSIYDVLAGATLSAVASFTFAPSPEVPLSSLTFTATATCPGCTAPLSYSWDFSSNDAPTYTPKSQATTNPATITPPPPVVNRVTVTITDAAAPAHSFAITRLLPLVSRESPSSTTVARKVLTGTFAGQWLGGITTAAAAYNGAWTFCPGSTLNKAVCSNPTVSFSQTPATVTQTNSQPALSYNYAGLYNATFKVSDTPELQVGTSPTGNVALLNFLVNVTGTPRAYNVNVSGNTTSISSGQAINFTAFSSYTANYTTARSSAFKYVWNFNDGSAPVTTSGNVTSVVHTFTVVGTPVVAVTATETANAAVTHIVEVGRLSVSVGGGYSVAITTAPTTGTVGTAVTFTATAGGGTPASFSWNFGDGTGNIAGGSTNPNTLSHTYNVKGTFTVHVNSTSSTGTLAQATPAAITISALTLAVSFTTAPTTGTVGTPVSFTASASGGTTPYSFSWSFGDGTAKVAGGSTNPNTQFHTYSSGGTFTVKVNATDANGKLATASATITISQILSVTFTTAPTTGTVGTAVSFTATASGGTTPYSFSWSFGDGTAKVAGGAANPNTQSHTYDVKGTYTVKVNVTDSNTKLATASATITISALTLAVSFTIAPTTGAVGTQVSFTANASGGTSPYSFSWNFGDGTANVLGGTTNPNTQSHTYTAGGTFTVKVNATDTNGKLASASSTITISQLVVTFTTAPTTGNVDTPVSFTASASGGTAPFTFSWNFGDGTANVAGGTTNPNSQSHTYTVKGSFTVKVNVTDATSKLASASASITITGTALVLSFTTAPTTGTVGTAVSFAASASGDTPPYTFNWNFGDGTANVAGGTTNPNTQSHTYSVKGTLTVKVNVTDANGAKQTASSTITIAPLLLAVTFTTAPTTGTVGTSVSFTASASGGTIPYSFSWSFGDGTANVAGGATNPNTQSHTYAAKGTFTVKVNVTDSNAKLASASATITIAPLTLAVSFTTAPTGFTPNTPVSFTATASGGTAPYSFSWNFGDGTANVAGGATNPNTQSHTYALCGTFTVKVNVTDANAKLATASSSIICNVTQLSVVFTTAPTTGTIGTSVSFTASATGGTIPYSFSWSFGDGTANVAGGASNPNTQSHTYNVKGTFTVRVNVTDSAARLASASTSITITGTPLTLSFTAAPTTGTVGTAVSFTASASGDTAPYSFSWSFGDGTTNVVGGTSNPNSQSHSYTSKGTFTVKVNATDANGAKASASTTITIAPLALAVSFTAAPLMGSVGTPVSFTASASGGTPPYSFSWSFGDGTGKVVGGTANPNTQSHTYAAAGNFTVKVNATDTNGKSASASTTIMIILPPPFVVTFTTAPTTGTVGIPANFTATVSGGTAPYAFSWNFGDGTANVAGGSANPNTQSHTYNVKGTFTVKVNATDATGTRTSASATITIAPLALAVTATVPTAGTVGTPISFTATASGGTAPYTFSWNFGDGTSVAGGSTNPNTQSHTYTVSGNFTVKVNATDINGKLAVASAAIMISQVSANPILLRFMAFNPTGSGTPGQLNIMLNGKTVANLQLTSKKYVSFSFDITSLVQNSNTLVFTNPDSHAVVIANLTIVQGSTVFLNITGTRGIPLSHSVTFTFSNTPLKLVSFAVSDPKPSVEQHIVFTATYTHGIGPVSCLFRFGNGESQHVLGVNGSCRADSDYDNAGKFTAVVQVKDRATGLVLGKSLEVRVEHSCDDD